MERLTVITNKGAALAMGGPYESEPEAREDLMRRYKVAVDRLAAYEDAMTLERVQELAQAEKDGRLVVLPCKVGDTVYRVFTPKGREPVIVPCEIKTVGQAADLAGKIGKKCWLVSAYLTREEAEEALRKEGDNG